jgi:hypothetical protein
MRERCNAQNVKRIMQGEETYNERSLYGMTYKRGAHTQIPPTPPLHFENCVFCIFFNFRYTAEERGRGTLRTQGFQSNARCSGFW